MGWPVWMATHVIHMAKITIGAGLISILMNDPQTFGFGLDHICRTGTGLLEWDYCSHDRHHTIYGEVCYTNFFLHQLLKGNNVMEF